MSWNTALIGKTILAAAIVSACPSVALSNVVPVTLLATGNVIIPASPISPESITFTGVPLIAGQTYWVAVLPETTTSGASWEQNTSLGGPVDFTGDGVHWGDSGFGPTAYPGEFDVIGSSSNVLYSNFAASPFGTGHTWGISGSTTNLLCTPNCYNGYASYFTPSVSDSATQIDVVLFQNNGYDPFATVNLYTSSQIAPTPEPAEGAILGGCLMLLLGARSWYRRRGESCSLTAPSLPGSVTH
jgi:hypothetical protein